MTVSTLKQDRRKQVPYFSTTVETQAEVDIDPDELHDAGQAHGRGDIAVCREEPCVSLSLRQLRGAA